MHLKSSGDGHSYVIALHELNRIPVPLRTLLNDPIVTFVGSRIQGDANRLAESPFKLPVASCADLAARGRELGLITKGQKRGLDPMCRAFLSKQIPNKSAMQMSDWQATPLSDEQVEYGAVDAVASAMLWEYFEAAAEAEKVPSTTSLADGTHVRVCNARHAGVAAIGVVNSREADDCFRVKLTAITKPGTKLMYPDGKQQALHDLSLGETVLWKRNRLRILPPSWSIDDHLHLIGRTWTDPCHDGGTFIVTGLFMHADGCFVDYRAIEDADKDDAELPKQKKPYSTLCEILRWLDGDFTVDTGLQDGARSPPGTSAVQNGTNANDGGANDGGASCSYAAQNECSAVGPVMKCGGGDCNQACRVVCHRVPCAVAYVADPVSAIFG